MRVARPAIVLLLATVVAGCARRPAVLPPPLPMDSSEVASLWNELRTRAASVRRYQGFVRVRGRGPEGGFEARLVVIFERPERLRVELLGAFSGTRWSAVADENEITAYFPGRRQFLREQDVADVVGRLLGLRLSSREVIAILAGGALPLEKDAPSMGERRGAIRILKLEDSLSGDVIEVDAGGQVRSARTARYRVSYPTDWLERGRQIPDRVRIENDRLQATLEAREVDVNVALDPDSFLLEIPSDAQRLRPAEVGGEAVFVIEKRPGSPEPK